MVDENSPVEVVPDQIKWWAGLHLEKWYKINWLQNIRTFNLRKPIKVECYFNNRLILKLTQKRIKVVSKIDRNNAPWPFQLQNSFYILVPFQQNAVVNKQTKKTTPPTNFNFKKYLDCIEYFNKEPLKYGTPILFTGWKD